jgi:phosphoribosylanthranilate isomerase
LKKANLQKPYFLSGGLGMEDLIRVQDFAASEKNFFSLDVNSRFELSPGIKNMAKLKDFITSIKEIN